MSDLQLLREPPFARILLSRPERRNAVSQSMWRALAKSCLEIEASPEIAAVIVEGAGGHFCSGADISEFDEVFACRESARAYLGSIENALDALAALDCPTIAKIEGSCMGGGLAIALACDLRFAADNVRLSIPPAKLGLLYGVAETRLLIEAVGPSTAKTLLFSARVFGAAEGLSLGLVNRVVPQALLAEAVNEETNLWARLSGASIRGAKRAIRATLAGHDQDVRDMVESVAMGPDFREGRTAFKEKRVPDFSRRA